MSATPIDPLRTRPLVRTAGGACGAFRTAAVRTVPSRAMPREALLFQHDVRRDVDAVGSCAHLRLLAAATGSVPAGYRCASAGDGRNCQVSTNGFDPAAAILTSFAVGGPCSARPHARKVSSASTRSAQAYTPARVRGMYAQVGSQFDPAEFQGKAQGMCRSRAF